MIIAKAVIPDQYWILKDGDHKVGNIEAGPDGFQVKINNNVEKFKTITTIKQRTKIDFEPQTKNPPQVVSNTVHGFPTTGYPHNPVFDVQKQLPLYTKEERSKSWYAAGWYAIRQGRQWRVSQCPKLIVLQRYQYRGPFVSQYEAERS